MHIQLVSAALPPVMDGIGDYTAHLAAELARSARVQVLTGSEHDSTPIAGVEIVPAFVPTHPRSVRALAWHSRDDRPDWVVLQFNQFSFGRWGWNPYLPLTMRAIKRQSASTRLAVMFHEDFVPITSWKTALMTAWQRWQFWLLGRTADLALFSIDPWAQRYRAWFPNTPTLHLSVGSNVPWVPIERGTARDRLCIPPSPLVLGLFGTAHASRMLGLARRTVEAARSAGHDVLLLYIGPHSAEVRDALGDVPMIAEGPLPAEEVSRRFAAIDVYLAPFIDGVSTRRTTLMTALQHGVATVGTRGPLTDSLLLAEDGRALLLADVDDPEDFAHQTLRLLGDSELRARLGRAAQRLYEDDLAWERITTRLLCALETV